ncbi:hypothetical protein PFISCL1PPCAC_18163, partial [Pristionchus fissidentatus]
DSKSLSSFSLFWRLLNPLLRFRFLGGCSLKFDFLLCFLLLGIFDSDVLLLLLSFFLVLLPSIYHRFVRYQILASLLRLRLFPFLLLHLLHP